MVLGWERFTEIFLSNIIKYDTNDIEGQSSIQGMSLGDLGDYLRKRKGNFNTYYFLSE